MKDNHIDNSNEETKTPTTENLTEEERKKLVIKPQHAMADSFTSNITDCILDPLELHSMSRKERRRVKLEFEKKKVNSLHGKERFFYLFSYYKWYVIIAFIAIIATISIVCTVHYNNLPYKLTCYEVHHATENETSNANDEPTYLSVNIENGYRDYYDADKNASISITTNHTLDATSNEALYTYGSHSDIENILTYIHADMLDVIICDQYTLDYLANLDEPFPISYTFPEDTHSDIRSIIDGDIAQAKNSEGNLYDCAIDITNTDLVKSWDMDYSPVYLIVPGTPKNLEGSINFIKYIYGK